MVVGSEARAYRTKPCKFYPHDGQCKKGSECVFQHINPETGEDEHERLSLAEAFNEGEDDQQGYAETLDQFAGEVEDDAEFDSQGGSSGQDGMEDEENKIKNNPHLGLYSECQEQTQEWLEELRSQQYQNTPPFMRQAITVSVGDKQYTRCESFVIRSKRKPAKGNV